MDNAATGSSEPTTDMLCKALISAAALGTDSADSMVPTDMLCKADNSAAAEGGTDGCSIGLGGMKDMPRKALRSAAASLMSKVGPATSWSWPAPESRLVVAQLMASTGVGGAEACSDMCVSIEGVRGADNDSKEGRPR